MKTIATYYSHSEADMLRLRLELSGVRVFLKDEFAGSMGAFAVMSGGIKVQVPEEDIPLIKELIETDTDLRDLIVPQSAQCPKCSSIHLRAKEKISIWFFIFGILCFALPFAFYKPTMECKDCRHSWKRRNF